MIASLHFLFSIVSDTILYMCLLFLLRTWLECVLVYIIATALVFVLMDILSLYNLWAVLRTIVSVIFVAKWRAVTSDRPSGILPDPSVCPMGKNSALVLGELYCTHVDSDKHLIKSVIPLSLFRKIFEYMSIIKIFPTFHAKKVCYNVDKGNLNHWTES